MTSSIAFVGAGPTTIYTLQALLRHNTQPFALTIFEEQAIAGRGTPYRPGWNDPAMLSNIASIEIPPLTETLVTWLKRQPEARLRSLGIDPGEINDRTFYPRLALGEFFKDQFQTLIEQANARGIIVDVRTRCRVIDAVSCRDGIQLLFQSKGAAPSQERFDYLVLATGHEWPENPEVQPGYFLSPWPASALANIPACAVGIRGTSLTAIDAVVALAFAHGNFSKDEHDRLRYGSERGNKSFHMTMMSRKGLLPEADFFHPVPYEPLSICTPEAVEKLLSSGEGDVLEKVFLLFKQELSQADPAYALHIKLAELSIEDFGDSYFANRMSEDPFVWAERNLREAEHNYAEKFTVPWRYAILRMHEVFALIVPHLDEDEFERFSGHLKPIFVDEYATIPHESIKRLLGLHHAGKLEIMAIGDQYTIDSRQAQAGVVVKSGNRQLHFPVFIEAMGQRPLGSKDFPFQSLRQQGIVHDQPVAKAGLSRGIVVDDKFQFISEDVPANRIFCLSLPFILGRHPFIQGITSSHEMGEIVGQELAAAIDSEANSFSLGNANSEAAFA